MIQVSQRTPVVCILAGSITISLAAPVLADAQFSASSPLTRATGISVPQGSVFLNYDLQKLDALRAAHQARAAVRITQLPLTKTLTVDLQVVPLNVMPVGTGAMIVSGDEVRRYEHRVITFGGYVVNRPNSTAYVSLSPEQVNGYFDLGDGRRFVLSSGSQLAAQPSITMTAANALGNVPPFSCGVDDIADHSLPAGQRAASGGGFPAVRVADVFIECDHEYTALFATPEQAADYAVTLVSWVSFIYRRDIGAEIRIPEGYIRVWQTPPPWGQITTFDDIAAVKSYWQSSSNPFADLERASVHVLTTPVFGGVAAAIGGLCTQSSGYDISSVYGSFPTPIQHTSGGNWDLLVVSHEFGHTFGSPHTFNYNPPIPCIDGSGPDNGTIMSYCHQQFGVGGVGMRFHPTVQQQIRSYIDNLGCLDVTNIDVGDYNHNGELDGIDLNAAAMCVNLEFVSSGCLDTFDLNADDQFTPAEYCTIIEAYDPALVGLDCNENQISDCEDIAGGLSEDCDGNGIPDECDDAIDDCNNNDIADVCEIAQYIAADCNLNAVPDDCDVAAGASDDCNGNGVPDECTDIEVDCNGNLTPDSCDLANGTSVDVDGNGVPDECHQTFRVPTDFTTLQAALDQMNSGDALLVADGIYTGDGNRNLDFAGKSILVRSENGPQNCIIDCQGAARGFVFDNGELPDAVLDGFSIRNAAAEGSGAGILCDGSSPTIRNCRLESNTSGSLGGGVYSQDGAPLIQRCVLTANTAALGAALAGEGSNLRVDGCVLLGNSAVGSRGGGLHVAFGNNVSVVNTLIADNTSAGVGGAVSVSFSNVSIEHCTLSGNDCEVRGGAIYLDSSSEVGIGHSIIWNNTAPEGAEIYLTGSEGIVSGIYNDLQGGIAAIEGTGDISWSATNINVDPQFVDSDGVDDDPSTWEDNNLHITAGSPCVDAGNPGFEAEPDEADVDNDPRVLDGDGDEIAVTDIGADEYQPCAADTTGDGNVDVSDLLELLALWGPCADCPADIDGDGEVGVNDLLMLIAAWGPC